MSNRKLLLADDSVTIQKVINLTFADEGIDVMTVGDGDTAMERFYEFRPDIVLADVNMPGQNGYRICESLRQREDSANIPVILLVGSFESFDENEARRVGANDWMTKPFQSIRQLVTKVTTLLNEPVASNGENHASPPPVFEEEPSPYYPETSTAAPIESTGENADIDDLYQQSFTKTAEMPERFHPELALGDTGMDDDMIETSYVQSMDEPPSISEFALPPEGEPPAFMDTFQSMSQDTVEMTFAEPAPEGNVVDFRSSPAHVEPPLHFDTPLPDFSSVPMDDEKGFSFQNEPEPQPEPQIVAESADAASFSPPLALDEIAPLEIPAGGSLPSSDLDPEDEIITLDASRESEKQPSSGDLSPEFIDAVARKVIERISENVIRQIAWQVVPQVVESVLREKNIERSN